jgi:hypothetical protein
MSDDQPDPSSAPSQQQGGQGDPKEHEKGGLSPAPTTPTEDKEEPEAGTGSADKRSPESLAEQDQQGEPGDAPGTAGGDITR